jgi:hypothetical protein
MDGLWDNATKMWAAQHDAEIFKAIKDLSKALFRHEAAIGLLALYIVANQVCEASAGFPWLADFNGALRRAADDIVPVAMPPRPEP